MINKKEERIKSFLFNFLLIINVPLRQKKKSEVYTYIYVETKFSVSIQSITIILVKTDGNELSLHAGGGLNIGSSRTSTKDFQSSDTGTYKIKGVELESLLPPNISPTPKVKFRDGKESNFIAVGSKIDVIIY